MYGKNGKSQTELVENKNDFTIIAGVDIVDTPAASFPVYKNITDVKEKADVIIDFSNSSSLDSLLSFAKATATPLVLCTTGYTDEQIKKIKETSKSVPVFFSFNMSLGVNLLISLSKKAATILGDGYDIEIIEAHHKHKKDAPSGTAAKAFKILAEATNRDAEEVGVYGREGLVGERTRKEIGIHAVRGGDIVGDHTVMFAGDGERIEIVHRANTRQAFINGVIKSLRFLPNAKSSEISDMNDVLGIK